MRHYRKLSRPRITRLLAVFGAGGLGAYAVQYAKLLSSTAPLTNLLQSRSA
jgi:D-arabinose 1-dehydrogenase-like Zn-dependent alcohol dehydrogenase